MKRAYAIFGTALALVAAISLAASCAQPGADFGYVRVALPAVQANANARGPLIDASDSFRVRILQFGRFVPPEGADAPFLEASTDQSLLIRLLPGDGYTLELVLGKGRGDAFAQIGYGATEPFSLSAGQTSTAVVRVRAIPFTRLSSAVSSSAVVNGAVWRLDGTRLIPPIGNAVDLTTALAGYTVHSLSQGQWFAGENAFAQELWLNTDKGIVPYAGGAFKTSFMAAGLSPNVTYSTAIRLDAATGNDFLLILYSGGGATLGGAAFNAPSAQNDASSAEWKWFDLQSLLAAGDQSMRDLLSGFQGDILSPPVFGPTYFYLNTPMNLFRMGPDLQNTIAGKIASGGDMGLSWVLENVFSSSGAIVSGVDENGDQLVVKAVAAANGKLLLAGAHGLYAAPIDANGKPTSAFALVGGTAGYSFYAASGTVFGDAGYFAALDSGGGVSILKDGVLVQRYAPLLGLPAGLAELTWIQGDALRLDVSGPSGGVSFGAVNLLN